MDIALAQKIIAAVIADFEGEYILEEANGEMRLTLANRAAHAETTLIKPYKIEGQDALAVYQETNGDQSYALYSLRCITEVVAYCDMLSNRYYLRAKRRRE